jgi:glutamine synthetase
LRTAAPGRHARDAFPKRRIAACAEEGYTLQAAFEDEFILAAKNPDGTFAPLDESLCFSEVGMTAAASIPV